MSKKQTLFLSFICIPIVLLGVVFVLLEWYPVTDGPPNKDLNTLSFPIVCLMLPFFIASLGLSKSKIWTLKYEH